MAIRMSGINSGLDTDAIVKALVTSYSTKKEKYTKAKTKLEWSQDAWKDLNKKVYSMYTGISNLRFSSAYSLKKTSVSDSTKATVTASNTAATGIQKLSIKQIAQSGYMTGGELKTKSKGSTKLSQLGITSSDAQIGVKVGDTTKSVSLSSSDTINDVVNKLKEAGVNANFDETNNRFYINSKTTGVDADFTLTYENSDGLTALKKLGMYTAPSKGTAAYDTYDAYSKLAGANDTGTATNINNAIASYNAASDNKKNANTAISNLDKAAGTYASAYSGAKDFDAKLAAKSYTKDASFDKIVSMSSTEKGNSIVDGGGNVYTKTSTDKDGNDVYANGSSYIVKKATSYSLTTKDEDGKDVTTDYTKVTEGDETYYKDAAGNRLDSSKEKDLKANYEYYAATKTGPTYEDKDGNAAVATKDADDKITSYSVTKDGNTTVYSYDEESKSYKDSDGNAMTFKEKYDYPAGSKSNVKTADDVYKGYVDELKDLDIKEEDITKYGSNLNQVKAMDNAVAAESEDDKAATYSITNLAAEIKSAYESGGTTAVDALATGYYNKMSEQQDIVNAAEKTMKDNSIVKDIAGLTGAELDTAVSSMVNKVNIAVSELANIGNDDDSYNAANKVDGVDAKITLNGVDYESSGNTFSINGLSITAQQATVKKDEDGKEIDDPITITTNTDTQGIYDKIKDFLTTYNSVINEMCKLYNAPSAKDYEPLTDDEKDEMSDKEVEKWETKIKDSLLRHDSTLDGVMSAMTSAMSKGVKVTVNGEEKTLTLASFGIQTLGFLGAPENEHYAYHIDGDPDDENSEGKADKLMSMINSDPDTVVSFFQGLSSNLYDAVGNKMKGSVLSSAYTIYNDKQMQNQDNEYKKLIKEWEEKIATKEDYYYKKFTAMESAMAKFNSTQSSLSSYFK